MKKFNVHIKVDETFEVEADNLQEAERKAFEQINDLMANNNFEMDIEEIGWIDEAVDKIISLRGCSRQIAALELKCAIEKYYEEINKRVNIPDK